MAKQDTLTTPIGRVMWQSCETPTKNDRGEDWYDLKLHIEKSNDISSLQQAIKAAAIDKWGPNHGPLKVAIKDGDAVVDKEGKPKAPGCWIFRLKTKFAPGVIDAAKRPLQPGSGLFYSGCYARATFHLYLWDHPTQGRGVTLTLHNVQKAADGEPIGGTRAAAEDEFGSLDETDAMFATAEDVAPF